MHHYQPTSESNLYIVDKPVGWTPLQALEELRRMENLPAEIPLTYAGRLDPMAEGLLLVLAGPRVHEKDAFLRLDKQYRVTALLGITTDSYDLLGLPSIPPGQSWSILNNSEQFLSRTLASFVGATTLPLPAFSSPPQQGKPLFWWKRNKPDQANLPMRTTDIYSITDIATGSVSANELSAYIHSTIPHIHGDFRQTEIVKSWETVLRDQRFTTTSFTVHCQSGTYIRSLVHELGRRLKTGACVYTLRRTAVGQYTF